MYGHDGTASFYCQREQKMHMWLPFLLKIKIYKRMMMMIFRKHLVLGTYARSFVFAIYFFLQCFISVLYKEGNILKARSLIIYAPYLEFNVPIRVRTR